jgi:hypothetical protein
VQDTCVHVLDVPRVSHALPGLLATTLLHAAGIDECATSAAADLDELAAAAGRLKQSNSSFRRSVV